jgi:hypothetical protein
MEAFLWRLLVRSGRDRGETLPNGSEDNNVGDDSPGGPEPYRDVNPMAVLMVQEDERRSSSLSMALFGEKSIHKRPTSNRRLFHGGHIGYEMARKQTAYFVGCSGCGTKLFRPQEVIKMSRAVTVSTTDSGTTLCVRDCDVWEAPDRIVHSGVLPSESILDHWAYTVRTIKCANCRNYLGTGV